MRHVYFCNYRRDVSCLASDLPEQGQTVPGALAYSRPGPPPAHTRKLALQPCSPTLAGSSAPCPPARAQGSHKLALSTASPGTPTHSSPTTFLWFLPHSWGLPACLPLCLLCLGLDYVYSKNGRVPSWLPTHSPLFLWTPQPSLLSSVHPGAFNKPSFKHSSSIV